MRKSRCICGQEYKLITEEQGVAQACKKKEGGEVRVVRGTIPPAKFTKPPKPTEAEIKARKKTAYENCQMNASRAPTEKGVEVGLRVCKEKYQ